MNRLQIILFSILFCLSSFVGYADDKPSQNPPAEKRVALFYPIDNINRPNSPTLQYIIKCYYNFDYMAFELPADVESLTIEIKGGNFIVWQGEVTVEEPYTEIPAYLSGEYDVECTTDMNQIFEGVIVF